MFKNKKETQLLILKLTCMTAVFCIIAVVALISIYDYLSSRSWQMVTSDIRNEVVFENRNKRYGAFVIRQDYNRNMVLIMCSVVFGSGLLFAAYKGFTSNKLVEIVPPRGIDIDPPVVIPLVEPKIPDVPEVPKDQPASAEASHVFIEPTIVDDPTKTKTLTQEELDKLKASSVTTPPIGPGIGTTLPVTIPVEPPLTPVTPKEPELIPDVDAQFPGGYPEMVKFIQKNLEFPQVLMESRDAQVKVYLRFVVSEDGDISGVKVMRGDKAYPECDKAAIKVVKKMPKWKPGQKNGQNVSSYFNLPINFQVGE